MSFYDNGLKFECQGCHYCCGVEPGYVFLSEDDIRALADHLSLSRSQFLKTYCRKVKLGGCTMYSLIEKENYDCIFLTEKGCGVYPARPVQCRTYPFWDHILASKEDWDREADYCPGINRGRKYSKQEIEDILNNRIHNVPVMEIG